MNATVSVLQTLQNLLEAGEKPSASIISASTNVRMGRVSEILRRYVEKGWLVSYSGGYNPKGHSHTCYRLAPKGKTELPAFLKNHPGT